MKLRSFEFWSFIVGLLIAFVDNDVLFVGTYGDDKTTLDKFQQNPL